jgi:hypothetical protein
VLVAGLGVEDIAGMERDGALAVRIAYVHTDHAVHHGKDFLAVVDVPFVRRIGPVQTARGAVHHADVERAPRALGSELAAFNHFHFDAA